MRRLARPRPPPAARGAAFNGVQVRKLPPRLAGDMNCDGLVNNFDIDGFVAALVSPSNYYAFAPNCNVMNADIDNSGTVTNFDIDPFVNLILN